MHKIQNPN